MGVYIFESKHRPYIKVGHYAGQNAWSRVAHRGFHSCAHPTDLTQLECTDIELVAWFPAYTKEDEVAVKRLFKTHRVRAYGRPTEWYEASVLPAIRAFLGSRGGVNSASACSLTAALASRRRL